MMAVIKSIGIFPAKKAPRKLVESASFAAGGGLVEDIYENDAGRGVSFMGAEAIEAMRTGGIEGLCTSKFSANIVTEGLDYSEICMNTELAVGSAVIKITGAGKECFAECGMADRSLCLLRSDCAFGAALTPGAAAAGDQIEPL